MTEQHVAPIGATLDEELARLAAQRQARIEARRRVCAEHTTARRYGMTARHRRRFALLCARPQDHE